MPYKLDRAIVLPSERLVEDGTEEIPVGRKQSRRMSNIKRYLTR